MHQPSFFSLPEVPSFVNPLDRGGSPILDSISVLTLRKVFYRSCHCNLVWCPKCFRRISFKKLQKKVRAMDWRKTRHVVLTVDRAKYGSGLEALKAVHEQESLSQLIWNLKRVQGVGVKKWLWIQEWHHDGYPHWHMLIETDKPGMIGGDLVRRYWNHGVWVKESYFRSQSHWNAIAGYFLRKGYFEPGKKYQSELPEWAKFSGLKIRRFSSSVEEENSERGVTWMEKKKCEHGEGREAKEVVCYAVRLAACGQFTMVSIDDAFLGVGYMIDIPFENFNKFMKGSYVAGKGYEVIMNEEEVGVLIELCEKHQKVKGSSLEVQEES